MIAFSAWTFVLTKLFVIDIDRIFLSRVGPSLVWVLDYRFFVAVGAVLVIALLFWKWKALGFICFIVFYPGVIVFWTIPATIVKKRLYKRWLIIFSTVNALTALTRNARYHAISKSAGLLAAAIILLSHHSALILTGASFILVLLLWATIRVVVQTFRSNTFVTAQRSVVQWASRLTGTKINVDGLVNPDGTLVEQRAQQFTANVQMAAISNRALYLWAYKLKQYRDSNLTFLFNLFSYGFLIAGATAAFALLNIAALKLDPAQYGFATPPSRIAMVLYGLSTLAVSEGGGVTAHGDVAYLLRILAGFYGPSFLLTAVINSISGARSSKGDSELRDLVRDLRRRGSRTRKRIPVCSSGGHR